MDLEKKELTPEKARLSYSRLRDYLTCPKRLALKRQMEADGKKLTFSASLEKAMLCGRIFESFVFGDKDGFFANLKTVTKDAKYVAVIKSDAENFIEAFPTDFSKGESYVKVHYETADWYINGEIDYLGEITYYDEEGILHTERAILDLKYTGSLDYVWKPFQYKEEVLQVLTYSMIHYENTGECLNAFYLVVEGNKLDNPAYSIKKVIIDPMDYDWVKEVYETAAFDYGLLPKPNYKNCLGGRGVGRCPYLEFCSEGRTLLGGFESVETNSLSSKNAISCNHQNEPEEDPEEENSN